VTWTKRPATPSGDVTVITHVYARNPATRTITVTVTDDIQSGVTLLDQAVGSPVNVPANTEMLVLTHQTTVPAGTTALNDVARATYTDLVTGVPVPGQTTATATAVVQQNGPVRNQTAVITDTETITGGLTYTVDSVTGASGSFSGSTWTSAPQSGNGSVTFNKTIHATAATSGSGTLSDHATITGSDGFTASTDASVAITYDANVNIVVRKSSNLVFDSAKTYHFTATKAGESTPAGSVDVTIPAGSLGPVNGTISGLDPGTYDVHEDATSPFAAQDHPIAVNLPSCSETLTVANQADPAAARVAKTTQPGGATSWDFTLRGVKDGSPVITPETITVTANTGYLDFTTPLEEDGATYTITEEAQTGWDLQTISGDIGGAAAGTDLPNRRCSVTLNLTTASGQTFQCTFANTQRGRARVVKTVRGAPPSGSQAFTFQLRQGATPTEAGTTLESKVANAANGGTFTFTTSLVPGASYQLCEVTMPGWQTSLGTFVPDSFLPPDGVTLDPNVDNSIICANFTVAAGETKVFTVDNTPPPGGRALTIGFWKNWASCSNSGGKQKPVLDTVLATFPIASGQSTRGVFIGDLYVDTCAEAVALLNKTAINSSKKMASDPAYNLASQLMAVELNFQAGAGKCPAVVTAEAQAQALLAQVDFNGTGSYKSMSAANQALANQLANTLDRYNNTLLC
jgi:hypothetical protein